MKKQNLHVADVVVSEFVYHYIWTQGRNLRTGKWEKPGEKPERMGKTCALIKILKKL
jgi:hypothetical protein